MHQLGQTFLQYLRARAGGVAVWVALGLPVLLGGAALSVDAARIYSLDQELQAAADALARAGSVELDQAPDSIERAHRAIETLVSNTHKFGLDSGSVITAESVRFLKELPEHDTDPVSSTMETDDPEEAKYLEVTVAPETVSFIFPKVIGSTLLGATFQAKSLAKSEQTVCGVSPMFVCNPWEGLNVNLQTALNTRSFQRRLMQIKAPKLTHGPGNFGFLDAGGGITISNALGMIDPPVCISEATGVNTQTGNIASLRFAINTRFDMYEGGFKKYRTDPLYAPAQNVTKGYSGSGCNTSHDSDAMAMPRDKCFADGSCPFLDGAIGDGDWDFANYVRVNHNAAAVLTIAGTTYTFDHANGTVAPNDIPTRYEVYRWEIETDSIPGAVSYGSANTPEEGTPQCHAHGPAVSEIDRRILVAAVLNCGAIEATLGLNGTSKGLPVEGFAKVFITEPMDKGLDNILWGEFAGPVVSGRDTVSRDRVSLVR